jgi:hypothetical protein
MHPYRDMETLGTTSVEELNLERCLRVSRAALRHWSLLRVVVAVALHRFPFEVAVAALLLVLVGTRRS